MRARGGPRGARGFTLLEVLVAFTILAVSLAAIYQVFGSGMSAARLGEAYTRAVLIAESRLAAIGAGGELEEGADAGEVDDTYRFETAVTPLVWQDPDAVRPAVSVDPYQATVVVSWDEGGRHREVSLTTILLERRR